MITIDLASGTVPSGKSSMSTFHKKYLSTRAYLSHLRYLSISSEAYKIKVDYDV